MSMLKSAIKHIAGVIVFAAIIMLARYYINADTYTRNKEPFSVIMARDAAQLNATLPEMVSASVRLDKAAAGPGNSFNYIYTIVDDDAARNVAGDPNELNKLKMQLQERVCSVMPAYRENGTIIKYSLKDIRGGAIAEVSINPNDC